MPECRNAGILSTARTGYAVGRERTPCPATSGGLPAVAFELFALLIATTFWAFPREFSPLWAWNSRRD